MLITVHASLEFVFEGVPLK